MDRIGTQQKVNVVASFDQPARNVLNIHMYILIVQTDIYSRYTVFYYSPTEIQHDVNKICWYILVGSLWKVLEENNDFIQIMIWYDSYQWYSLGFWPFSSSYCYLNQFFHEICKKSKRKTFNLMEIYALGK